MRCTICKRFWMNRRADRIHGCIHCEQGCQGWVNPSMGPSCSVCECKEDDD